MSIRRRIAALERREPPRPPGKPWRRCIVRREPDGSWRKDDLAAVELAQDQGYPVIVLWEPKGVEHG